MWKKVVISGVYHALFGNEHAPVQELLFYMINFYKVNTSLKYNVDSNCMKFLWNIHLPYSGVS